MLETNSLQYQYLNGESFNFPDISCQSRDQLLVLGSSGVGKSTFLHLLGGVLRAPNGTIHLDGQNLMALNNKELDRYRGKNIGIIFQRNHFIASLTVLENLTMAQYFSIGKTDKKNVSPC